MSDMQTELNIPKITVDNIDLIAQELQDGKNFKLVIYNATDEEKAVGMWLEHTDESKECTIMFEMTKEEALFFGKSLVALAENV